MKATYTNLFIDLTKYAALTTLIVGGLVTTAAIASSENLKVGGTGPMTAKSAQLAIKSPSVNVCPTTAKMAGWIHTNKPGKVSYMIAKKGGGVSGPYILNAVKSANGGMASFARNLQIHHAINTEYRILVAGPSTNVMSNWVPLTASCKIQLGG